jgi:hypothetical protein
MKETSPATHSAAKVVALLVIGAVAGALIDPYLPALVSNSKKGYQAGFNAARTLVLNSSLGAFLQTSNNDVRALAGTVTYINGSFLTLHVKSLNPFDDPALADRVIVINASTTVTRITQKDPVAFQAEMAAFLKANAGRAKPATAPVSFTTAAARVSDIKVGDTINVLAFGNVKTVKEFVAHSIQIQQKVAP